MMPEIQERVDSDTVYCKVCGYQLSSALSTLSVHNMRRHEYHPDLYDYEDWEQECDFCGGKEYAGLERDGEDEPPFLICDSCGEIR